MSGREEMEVEAAIPSQPPQRSGAFSLAEVIVSMTIVLFLISAAITLYEQPAEDARRSLAKVETERIATQIRAWQLQRRSSYLAPAVPATYQGKPFDPWGTPYRVDPKTHSVASAGPDGVFDSSDDLTSSWEPWPGAGEAVLPAPSARLAGSSAVLEWSTFEGLRVTALVRSGPDGVRTIALAPSSTRWQDDGLAPRTAYSYHLEATDPLGRTRVSAEAGVFAAASGPPTLSVSASPGAAGRTHLRLDVRANGAELELLTVGARTFPLHGSFQSVTADVMGPVSITLTDKAGGTATATAP